MSSTESNKVAIMATDPVSMKATVFKIISVNATPTAAFVARRISFASCDCLSMAVKETAFLSAMSSSHYRG